MCVCVWSSYNELRWSDSIRYLGVYLASSRVLSCSLKYAKRSFYRAFSGIFGKVGSIIASETVVIELLKSKCMPILFYGLEVCPLNKSNIKSIDYAIGATAVMLRTPPVNGQQCTQTPPSIRTMSSYRGMDASL